MFSRWNLTYPHHTKKNSEFTEIKMTTVNIKREPFQEAKFHFISHQKIQPSCVPFFHSYLSGHGIKKSNWITTIKYFLVWWLNHPFQRICSSNFLNHLPKLFVVKHPNNNNNNKKETLKPCRLHMSSGNKTRNRDMNHNYPVILRILGFFSFSFNRKIHHPWLTLLTLLRSKSPRCEPPLASSTIQGQLRKSDHTAKLRLFTT